jgi:hypothetical protein
MDKERIQKGQTVIVRNGRIAKIGPAGRVRVPKGGLRIDGRGKYLMPGLADMHIHAYSDETDLFLYIANGVTTVRSMDGQPSHLRLRERIASGEVLGPSFYTCGPIVDGLQDPEQARQIVAEQSKAGYDCIKIYNRRGWSKQAYDAIIEAARSSKLPAVGHIPLNLPLEDILRPGLLTAEHTEQFLYSFFFRSEKVKRSQELAEAQIPFVAKLMKDADISLTPTLSVYGTIPLMLDDTTTQGLLRRPEVKYINRQVKEKWMTELKNDYRRRFGADKIPYFKENLAFLERFTRGLHDTGVRILLGSDTAEDQAFMVPGFSIHDELRELVNAGLTPFEAIRAGTTSAAEVLNALSEFGTVTVSRRADLILLEGNPLKNIAYAARPAGVMVRGQWFPRVEIQQKLDALSASYTKR